MAYLDTHSLHQSACRAEYPPYTAEVRLDNALDVEQFLRDYKDDWGCEIQIIFDKEGRITAAYDEESHRISLQTIGENEVSFVVKGPVEEDEKIPATCFLVRMVATMLGQSQAGEVYVMGKMWKPMKYRELALFYKSVGQIPLLNLIGIGLYSLDGETLCGYTYGMEHFGKMNLEIVNSIRRPEEIRQLLADAAYYVFDNGKALHSGDTIGFPGEDNVHIQLSPGVSVGGITAKLALDTRPFRLAFH